MGKKDTPLKKKKSVEIKIIKGEDILVEVSISI